MRLCSATVGGILDRAIEAENKKHGDFMRLVIVCSCLVFPLIYIHTYIYLLLLYEQDHVEGYLELSAKTKTYFATAVSMWDAEYYVKVDDDVHVNIGN